MPLNSKITSRPDRERWLNTKPATMRVKLEACSTGFLQRLYRSDLIGVDKRAIAEILAARGTK